MSEVKISVDGQELSVEAKELTVLVHPDTIQVDVIELDFQEITPIQTVQTMEQMALMTWAELREAPLFLELWKLVYPDLAVPEIITKAPIAQKHIAGMIYLIIEAMIAGKKPFVRLPETYLHPSTQLRLGDLFAYLANSGTGSQEQTHAHGN